MLIRRNSRRMMLRWGPATRVEVVQSYIDALRTGDVGAALRYRCNAAEDLPVDIAEQQIDRLFRLMGEVEAVEVREVERTGVVPVDDLPDPVEVGYRLVIDGERHPEMLAVTVLEDGERRWCGRATSAASRIVSERVDALVAQPTTATGALIELMPETGPPGETLQQDEASVPTAAFVEPYPGQMGSWTRSWAKPDVGGSRVSAIRFESEHQAVEAARSALRSKASDGVQTFSIEGVPGAVGIRVLELAWLDVQAPDVGPYVDWVYVVYGQTVVEVAVSELLDDPDHEGVAALAQAVHAAATTSPA
jgi:hypothetical protein